LASSTSLRISVDTSAMALCTSAPIEDSSGPGARVPVLVPVDAL
jgi:hypothetical protein